MAKKKIKKEIIVLSGKKALINSANKLNRSMPEVSRGCGVVGDKKYNRKKEKRVVQKEMNSNLNGSFYLLKIKSVVLNRML